MSRFATFRFDDGLIDGARKSAAILHPSRASYFIVADWVRGTTRLDHIESLRGRGFGSVAEWTHLSLAGHDVQAHSASHPDFTQLDPSERAMEIRKSLAFMGEIHPGPYTFAFPFNAIPPDVDLASFGLAAAGFHTGASDEPIIFNSLGRDLDLLQLNSWAVREHHLDRIRTEVDQLPEDSWTIFALHSLDGDGFEPWTSAGFAHLVHIARNAGLMIVTVRDMIEMVRAGAPVRGMT